MMCGGASDIKAANEEIQALVEALRDDLEGKAGRVFTEVTAIHFKQQVVAGMNYFVKVHTGEEKYIHAAEIFIKKKFLIWF